MHAPGGAVIGKHTPKERHRGRRQGEWEKILANIPKCLPARLTGNSSLQQLGHLSARRELLHFRGSDSVQKQVKSVQKIHRIH